MTGPRFPPPWSIGEYNDACFTVRDNNGQQLAYVYFEDELFRGRTGPPLGGQAFDARRGAAHRRKRVESVRFGAGLAFRRTAACTVHSAHLPTSHSR
jgi:hypothetical protein